MCTCCAMINICFQFWWNKQQLCSICKDAIKGVQRPGNSGHCRQFILQWHKCKKQKKKKKETIHWTLPFYPANSLRMIITVYIFEAEILYDHAEGNNLFLSTDSPPSYWEVIMTTWYHRWGVKLGVTCLNGLMCFSSFTCQFLLLHAERYHGNGLNCQHTDKDLNEIRDVQIQRKDLGMKCGYLAFQV